MTATTTPRPDIVGDPPGPAAPARVSPFVLPASTTSQLLLLVTLVAAVAAFTYDQILGGADFWGSAFAACVEEGNRQAVASVAALDVTRAYVDCYDGVLLRRGASGLLGVVLVLALVAVGVAVHPWLLTRWEGLRPFDPADFPAAVGDIECCLAEAGLDRGPTFSYEAFRSDRGGRAFGSTRRPRVRLALEVLPRPGAPEADHTLLRAVVRHELAHVRNRDLTLTAMAVVVPYVFVAAVVVPLMVKLALHSPSELWTYGWRMAVLLGLLLLVRASVFRAREHYADVRASVTGPVEESSFLAEAFPDDARSGPLRRAVRIVRGRIGMRPHPSPTTRSAVVDRPARLSGAGLAEGAAAGVTAGVASYFLRNLVVTVVGANYVIASTVAGVVVGALVATVTGQSMWRAALAAAVEGRPVPSGVRTAVGLAGGLLAAELVTPPVLAQWPHLLRADAPAALLSTIILLLGCVVFTRWCAASATTWLGATRACTLRAPLRGGMVVGATVFGATYATWSSAVGTASGSPWPLGAMAVWAINPLLVLAVAPAAAYGLLAFLAARRGAAPARDLLLDAPHRHTLVAPRLRPALVLVPGLAVALLYLVLDAALFRGGGVLRILAATRTQSGTPGTEALANAQVYALVAFFLAAEIAVVVGVGMALRRGRVLGTWTHLVAAAVVTGHLLGMAFPAYPLVMLCGPANCDPRFWAIAIGTLSLVTTMFAALVALPVWLVGIAVDALGRATSPTRAGPPPPMPPPRHQGRAAAVAAVGGRVLAAVVLVTYAIGMALALTYALNLVGSGQSSVVPADVRDAPVDTTPTTVTAACGAFNARNRGASLVVATDTLMQLQIARALAAVSDGELVRRVGEVKENALLDGDGPTAQLADRALQPLCSGYPPVPLP